MKSKLRVSIVLMVVLLVISTVYYFNRPEHSYEAPLPKEAEGKTVVNLWMKNSNEVETRRNQIERYNLENDDNIYINFVVYGSDYTNMLKVALSSSRKPDIFQYGYATLLTKGEIEPLDDFGIDIESAGNKNFLYYNGKPYAATLSANKAKLLWNKEMFAAAGLDPETPPKTWEEVIAYSEKIKEKFPEVVPFSFPVNDYDNIKLSIGNPSVGFDSIYHSFWNYEKGQYEFDSAKNILEVYRELYSKGMLDEKFAEKNRKNIRLDFYRESVAMIIGTYEDNSYFNKTEVANFEIGVADLPVFSYGNTSKYYTIGDYKNMVIRKDVENKEAVKKVMEWLMSSDVNRELLISGDVMPLFLDETDTKNFGENSFYGGASFENAILDPTLYISYNANEHKNLIVSAIDGSMEISDVINKLNDNYKKNYERAVRDSNFNFDFYRVDSSKSAKKGVSYGYKDIFKK